MKQGNGVLYRRHSTAIIATCLWATVSSQAADKCAILTAVACAETCVPQEKGSKTVDFSCGDWWTKANCCNGTNAVPFSTTNVFFDCSCECKWEYRESLAERPYHSTTNFSQRSLTFFLISSVKFRSTNPVVAGSVSATSQGINNGRPFRNYRGGPVCCTGDPCNNTIRFVQVCI